MILLTILAVWFWFDRGFVTGLPEPVGLWPLTYKSSGRDVSRSGAHGLLGSSVTFACDPADAISRRGVLRFPGTDDNSRMVIPNWPGQALDVRNKWTVAVYVKLDSNFEAVLGPVPVYAYYNKSGAEMGSQLVLYDGGQYLSVRAESVDGKSAVLKSNVGYAQSNRWIFITAGFDPQSGLATIWKDGTLESQKNLPHGNFDLQKTGFPVYVGSLPGLTDRFIGLIYCLQVYGAYLTQDEVQEARLLANNGCNTEGDEGAQRFDRYRLLYTDVSFDSNVLGLHHTTSTTRCGAICTGACSCVAFGVKRETDSVSCVTYSKANSSVIPSAGTSIFIMIHRGN